MTKEKVFEKKLVVMDVTINVLLNLATNETLPFNPLIDTVLVEMASSIQVKPEMIPITMMMTAEAHLASLKMGFHVTQPLNQVFVFPIEEMESETLENNEMTTTQWSMMGVTSNEKWKIAIFALSDQMELMLEYQISTHPQLSRILSML